MIDTDKYEGHTKEKWCARNVGDGSPMSCDKDYDHDHPFIETQTDTFENPAIGYFGGGREAHSLEERRANMKLIADAPLLLEHVKCLTKTLELIGKNMPYDSWMHTLIKDVIGFEKWQAKEMRKMASEGGEEE